VASTSSEEVSPSSLAFGYYDRACKEQATAQRIVVNKLTQLTVMLSNRNRLKSKHTGKPLRNKTTMPGKWISLSVKKCHV